MTIISRCAIRSVDGGRGKVRDVDKDETGVSSIGRASAVEAGASATTNVPKVGGSTPSLLTILPKFTRDAVGLPECPYLRRWILDFGAFSIRVHRWQSSDDARAFHDHPWWFLTLVLRGRYVDISPDGRDALRAGSVRFRHANHRHTVEITRPGTTTLLLTGPTERRWGFWVNGKLIRRDKYFATHGHHPCQPAQRPVRMRPDGERIT